MDILKTGLKDLNSCCEHVLRTFEVRFVDFHVTVTNKPANLRTSQNFLFKSELVKTYVKGLK